MVFSSIHAHDDLGRYPPAIRRAVEYLMRTDFSALPDGRQAIDGERMFANVFHLTSKPLAQTRPELHRKYADVQFWLDGEELCGAAPYTGRERCVDDSRADEDLYFYEDMANESFLHATPGCYAVFFPNDAHRPGICLDSHPLTYRKVVVKVSVDLL